MLQRFNKFLDHVSEFLAARKGFLPLIGLVFVLANLVVRLFFPGWLADTDLLLHTGVFLAILGFLLAWAL